MLLINAKVGLSQIHGLGLIAQQRILAGTVVWEYRPGFDLEFSDEDLNQLSAASRSQVLHYCDGDFCPERKVWTLSGDDARFTNHADDANTINSDDGQQTVAVRDIDPGEEITWDYRSFCSGNLVPGHSNSSVLLDQQPTLIEQKSKQHPAFGDNQEPRHNQWCVNELPTQAAIQKVHSFLSDKCFCKNSHIDRRGIFAKSKIDEGEILAIWGG
jgi:hypothetical protein